MIGAGRAGIRSPSSDGLETSTPGLMSKSTSAKSLHGDTSDRSPLALLIIDAINDFAFPEGPDMLPSALSMAASIRRLKSEARRFDIPTIYVNDNFGRWRSDFRSVVAHCQSTRSRGSDVTRLLRPDARDYFVLKPRHSGFFSTTLDLLLEHLETRSLILCGLLADSCVLFTAQDAYMRGYQLVVPADCVASQRPADTVSALAHMRRVLGADIAPSTNLELARLLRSAGRAGRSGVNDHIGRRPRAIA